MKFNNYFKPILSGYYKHYRYPNQRLALVVGMLPWKDIVNEWVFESAHVQIQRHFDKQYFNLWLKPFIHKVNPVIYIWGYKAPQYFIEYVRAQGVDIFFLEDGFIRSGPDDDSSAPPLSIVMDSQAPYFDTTRPNDLTDLIANFNFKQDNYDEVLAQEMLDYYVSHRVSKYNHQPYVDVAPIYGTKNRERILVFEALLRGKKVTVLGRPFYSGWGLTQPVPYFIREHSLSLKKLSYLILTYQQVKY